MEGNIMKKIDFNEDQIGDMFGELDAQEDNEQRLDDFFLKTDVFEKIHNNRPLRIIVAQKGVGKSAILRKSYLENIHNNQLSLWVRPDDIENLETIENSTDTIKLIRQWKNGLEKLIITKVCENFEVSSDEEINKYFKYSFKITDKLLKIIKKANEHVDISEVNKLITQQYMKTNKIVVYIDDLDRAWNGSKENIARISALVTAARNMCSDDSSLKIRISLRSDVYYLFRKADESTDKVSTNVITLDWTQHELLAMLVKRIQLYFGNKLPDSSLLEMSQDNMAEHLNIVMEDKFKGRGKWNNAPLRKILLSLARKRPRDLINLCVLGARSANTNKRDKIITNDWESSFSHYSQDRFNDTIVEHKFEIGNLESLLKGMTPTTSEMENRREKRLFIYDTKGMLTKIRSILERGDYRFSNQREKATPQEVLAFLYKINFLTARKTLKTGFIDTKYFEDNNYLAGLDNINFGYDWEVHPAFRKVLYPTSNDIFETMDIPD